MNFSTKKDTSWTRFLCFVTRPLVFTLVFQTVGYAALASAANQPTSELLERMHALTTNPPDVRLQLHSEGESRIGDAFEVELRSASPRFALLLEVTPQGMIIVEKPDFGRAGNYVPADQTVFVPKEGSRTFSAPVGQRGFFSVLSETRDHLPTIDIRESGILALDPAEALRFADEIEASLLNAQVTLVGKVISIDGRDSVADYTKDDIVRYFTQKTRSASSPSIPLNILFATNSDVIEGNALDSLALWGDVLSDPLLTSAKFRIEGHTDDVGTHEYNMELSKRRAKRVVEALTSVYGIAPERLRPVGFGLSRPQVTNASDDSRQQNRRVEFVRIGRYEG